MPSDTQPGEAAIAGRSRTSRLAGVLRQFQFTSSGRRAGSKGVPKPTLSDEQVRQQVTGLDLTERKVGYLGAALAAVLALGATLPYVMNPHKAVTQTQKATAGSTWVTVGGVPVKKATEVCPAHYSYSASGKDCVQLVFHDRQYWVFVLLVLLLLAIVLLVATRIGRRAPLGFAALLSGFAFESQVGLLGLPFIFGGGWLLVRAWRVQRYGTPNARGAMATAREGPPRRGRSGAAGGGRPAGKQGKAATATADRRPNPSASKRYTPKAKPKPAAGSTGRRPGAKSQNAKNQNAKSQN